MLRTLDAPSPRPPTAEPRPVVPDAAADRAERALVAILDELAAAALLSDRWRADQPIRFTHRPTASGNGWEATVAPDPGGATLPPGAEARQAAEAAAERWRARTALRPEEARVVYGWEGVEFVVKVERRADAPERRSSRPLTMAVTSPEIAPWSIEVPIAEAGEWHVEVPEPPGVDEVVRAVGRRG